MLILVKMFTQKPLYIYNLLLLTKIHENNVPIPLIKYGQCFWLVNPKTKSNAILPLNILLGRQGIRWPRSLKGPSWIWCCLNHLDHWKRLSMGRFEAAWTVGQDSFNNNSSPSLHAYVLLGYLHEQLTVGGRKILSLVYKWVCMKCWYYLKRTDAVI